EAEVPEDALQVVPERPPLDRIALEHLRLHEPEEELLRDVVRVGVVLRPRGARVVADRRPVAPAEGLDPLPVLLARPELPEQAPGRLRELAGRRAAHLGTVAKSGRARHFGEIRNSAETPRE